MAKPKHTENHAADTLKNTQGAASGIRIEDDSDDAAPLASSPASQKAPAKAVAAKPLPPAPDNKAKPAPAKTKAEILAGIRAESEKRVNYENFLHEEAIKGNRYDIPPHLIPDGFTVEWKTTHVMGQPVGATEMAGHEQNGWTPAPASLFLEMMPVGYDKETIERDGMMLYIRPREITDRFRDMELRNARAAIKNKQNELNNTKDGQMDRIVHQHKVSKTPRIAVDGD